MAQYRVINFHGIGTPQRELEPGEAPYWISEERYRYILDCVSDSPDKQSIVITFDDGNLSDLEIGLPELVKRGLTAEFFILSGRIGTPGSLDEEGIRQLIAAGMRIGSHGVAHVDLTVQSPEQLREELETSRRDLETVCQQAVRSLSAPFGRYNAAVLDASRVAGYDYVYSSNGGAMNDEDSLRTRTSIRHDMSDATLDAILSGKLSLAGKLRRSLGRLRRYMEIRLKLSR